MTQPNDALRRFHREFFSGSNVEVESMQVFNKLLEEINKFKGENGNVLERNNSKRV